MRVPSVDLVLRIDTFILSLMSDNVAFLPSTLIVVDEVTEIVDNVEVAESKAELEIADFFPFFGATGAGRLTMIELPATFTADTVPETVCNLLGPRYAIFCPDFYHLV